MLFTLKNVFMFCVCCFFLFAQFSFFKETISLKTGGDPSNYTLSNDQTGWNMSDILSQLPLDVLMYRCLCSCMISAYYSLNVSETCSDTCNTDNTTTAACAPYFCNIEPLLLSSYNNPISDIDLSGCGLKCNAGPLVYGLKDNEQSLADAFKVIGPTVCFIAIIFIC